MADSTHDVRAPEGEGPSDGVPKNYELTAFEDEELTDVLPTAPLRADIEKYHAARERFLKDVERDKKMVRDTIPYRRERILTRPIRVVLFEKDDSPRDADGIQEELNKVRGELDDLDAQKEEYLTGHRAAKLERRHEALVEVYEDLKRRLDEYTSNLSTNRALFVLMDEGEDDGEETSETSDTEANDGESDEGVEARPQAETP